MTGSKPGKIPMSTSDPLLIGNVGLARVLPAKARIATALKAHFVNFMMVVGA
jgi:hypothetical protein